MKRAAWSVFHGLARLRAVLALVLVFTALGNTSVPFVTIARSAFRQSTDKERPRNAAAWKGFQENNDVQQLIQEEKENGHRFLYDQPRFIDVGKGEGGDWVSVAVAGVKGKSESTLVVGLYNLVTDKIERTMVLRIQSSNGKQLRVESKTFAMGRLVKTAGVTYDHVTNRWIGDDGTNIGGNEKGRTAQFGSTAEARCWSEFFCAVQTGIASMYVCWAASLLGGLAGVLCGLTFIVISYLACSERNICQ